MDFLAGMEAGVTKGHFEMQVFLGGFDAVY